MQVCTSSLLPNIYILKYIFYDDISLLYLDNGMILSEIKKRVILL